MELKAKVAREEGKAAAEEEKKRQAATEGAYSIAFKEEAVWQAKEAEAARQAATDEADRKNKAGNLLIHEVIWISEVYTTGDCNVFHFYQFCIWCNNDKC